jgi:hypothetical protein
MLLVMAATGVSAEHSVTDALRAAWHCVHSDYVHIVAVAHGLCQAKLVGGGAANCILTLADRQLTPGRSSPAAHLTCLFTEPKRWA